MAGATKNDSDWICKQCGSQNIKVEVEPRGPYELGGRIRERNGKPHFDEDLDLDRHDFDVADYVCECGASASTIDKLVVRRRAFNEMRLPCGRCDHAAHEHPQLGNPAHANPARDGFTRPPMPCTVQGCDCHDFYDRALELEPNWEKPGQQVMV